MLWRGVFTCVGWKVTLCDPIVVNGSVFYESQCKLLRPNYVAHLGLFFYSNSLITTIYQLSLVTDITDVNNKANV